MRAKYWGLSLFFWILNLNQNALSIGFFRECVRVLKGFEAANLRQLIQHVTPPPPKPFFSSAWKSLTQIKETWVKHDCFDMLTKFHWNNGKWCFLKTEMMQIRYSIMKLNKHIIKENQFDSARPCKQHNLGHKLPCPDSHQSWGKPNMKPEILGRFPLFSKIWEGHGQKWQNRPKTAKKRRRASQKTSQDVAENVAGRRRKRRRRRRNVAGRRRASQARFLAKVVVSTIFLPKLGETLVGASFRHTFGVKMQIFDWNLFSQLNMEENFGFNKVGGLCVFQRKLANRVPLFVFGHPTSKPTYYLYPADPMLPTLWHLEDPQKNSTISLNIGHNNFKIFWGSSLCYLRNIAKNLL